MGRVTREARVKGSREERVSEMVEERTRTAEEAEKGGRSKRGVGDLRDEEGDERMELDGAGQGQTTRSGRVSKRLGMGRHG